MYEVTQPLRSQAREICERRIEAFDSPSSVLTKRDFVKRFQAGEFGNKTQNWDTVQEFLLEDTVPKSLLHLRNRIANGPTWYNLTYQELVTKCQELRDVSNFYVATMAPTIKTVFQGEVMETHQGLSLFYSTVAKPMRDALRESSRQVFGLCAIMTLRHFLDPVDLDWIQELLQRYRNHVVEFSTYSIKCGTLNRRTIIWEVRNY